MKKGELLKLVETVGREFGLDNGIYFAMAEAGRTAALDRVGEMFNGPWKPEASKAKPKAKANARVERALRDINKPPKRPRTSPSTVLGEERRRAISASKDAVDATATEDVMRSIQEHVGPVDAARIAQETSLPTSAVSRILAKLTRAKLVVKTGTRRGCRYALPGAEKQASLLE